MTHTILTCMYPKEGQKSEATKENNMGEYQAKKEWLVGSTSKNNSEKFEECHTPTPLNHHETDIGCNGHFLLINVPCRR